MVRETISPRAHCLNLLLSHTPTDAAGPGKSRVINVTQGDGSAGEMELVEIWEEPADYLIGKANVGP